MDEKTPLEIYLEVKDVFAYQFEGMIEDVLKFCEETLTPDELEWARKNLTVGIIKR